MENAIAILGIVTGLIAIGNAVMGLGREKQARLDLERRHQELAKDTHTNSHETEKQNEKVMERLTASERDLTDLRARHEDLRSRLEDVKREKASVELVEALRESLGRVEGTMQEVARRVESTAQDVSRRLDAIAAELMKVRKP